MHAKAYIFDYGKVYDSKGKAVERHEKGIAIVGSSNLTLSGVTHNTELNVIVQGNDNHAVRIVLGHPEAPPIVREGDRFVLKRDRPERRVVRYKSVRAALKKLVFELSMKDPAATG